MPAVTCPTDLAARYDRQVRAFGAEGQHRLRTATIAVVGAGGIGSLLVQSLAHLGAGRLIIIDPDHVDETNLNRLAGATADDAELHLPKTEVAMRLATGIDPLLPVHAISGSVLDEATWRSLRCADIILGAVDGHAPRWALNTLAVQYARHYIDTGTEITRDTEELLNVSGHVATVTPGGPCLLCLSGYDPRAASTELDPALTAARRTAGYLPEAADEPSPSVIFLNQAIAAIATGEVLNLLTGWHPHRPYTLIDLTTPTLTPLHADPQPGCPACGPDSPRAESDLAGILRLTAPSTPPQT